MTRKKEPPSFLRRNFRKILGIAIFAMAIHDVFGAHGFIAMRKTQTEITHLTAQIHQLDEQNQSLSNEVNALKTDPRLIERIAREDMGLARPGEYIFKMPATPDDPSQTPPAKKKN
jgi:cell division protein FtsL